MPLNLIAGTPATTDIAAARQFPTKGHAESEALNMQGRIDARGEVRLDVLTFFLNTGRRCWVLRQHGGARTVTKYVAEVKVVDATA